MSPLAEAAGGQVLEEFVLDQRLARALAERGITLGEQDLRREERLLRESLVRGVGAGQGVAASDDAAVRLERDLRAAQGLGPVRFAALLRRSAGLRALVQADVAVTPEAVQVAHAVRHGPRHRIRLITVATQKEAAAVIARLAQGQGTGGDARDLMVRFASLAAELSTDPSAARGGAIEAFSVQDPAYPAALRQAVAGTAAGGLTPILALSRGFGIALVEEVVPASGVALDTVREALEADVRLRQERLLMEREAARLIGQSGVTVIDRALEFGWRNRRAGAAVGAESR